MDAPVILKPVANSEDNFLFQYCIFLELNFSSEQNWYSLYSKKTTSPDSFEEIPIMDRAKLNMNVLFGIRHNSLNGFEKESE